MNRKQRRAWLKKIAFVPQSAVTEQFDVMSPEVEAIIDKFAEDLILNVERVAQDKYGYDWGLPDKID